jgi:hypothetical protein
MFAVIVIFLGNVLCFNSSKICVGTVSRNHPLAWVLDSWQESMAKIPTLQVLSLYCETFDSS